MGDLAVKLFMVENKIDNIDVAENMMYKYGLAEPYEDFANRLQFLMVDDNDAAEDEAFADGVDFVAEVVRGLRFQLPRSAEGSEFVRGINIAMEHVYKILDAAVAGTEAMKDDLSIESVLAQTAEFFRNEPTKG